MSSLLSSVKKSTSVPHCFFISKPLSSGDQGYYEEAWDLRMARLGIDIDELNSIFIAKDSENLDNSDCGTMTRSCIDTVKRPDPPIIKMTSSAIESTVMANNPVYSFKQFENSTKSVTSSPVKNNPLNDTLKQHRTDSERTLNGHVWDTTTLCPRFNCDLILNNTCYELAPSQLVNAIIDKDREPYNTRLFTNDVTSAFKPLSTVKYRLNQPSSLCNNSCYTSIPVSTFNTMQKMSIGYNRQISAPVDSTTESFNKITYPDLEKTSKTLQYKYSRRSMKSGKQSNLSESTFKKGDQHLSESSRMNNSLMSKSMISDESRLSDNYIKHLTGQEIAGNFIKQSQRPECHIQRTEDRYHMGFNDSRLDMIADSNRPLEEHLWYHPFLSRVASEQLLAKYPEGSFLVRRSESSANEYSLSIRYKQKWLHMKISRDVDGQFVLGQYSQPYPSIPIMIRHYSCSFLPVKGANLISLQQPVFRH